MLLALVGELVELFEPLSLAGRVARDDGVARGLELVVGEYNIACQDDAVNAGNTLVSLLLVGTPRLSLPLESQVDREECQ